MLKKYSLARIGKNSTIKSLSIAAFAGILFGVTTQSVDAQETTTYGDGENARYYQWIEDSSSNKVLTNSTEEDADIIVKYADDYRSNRYDMPYDVDTLNSDFVDSLNYYNGESGQEIQGGALNVRSSGTSYAISGTYVGNRVVPGTRPWGGAIYTRTSGSNIQGDFVANYVSTSNSSKASVGGAIANLGTVNVSNSNFIGNYSQSYSNLSIAGALYNNSNATIYNSNFVGNYSIGNSARAGAINNEGTMYIINSSFRDNYAASTSSSFARGGAIWTTSTVNLSANNGYNSIFSGNYIQVGRNGTKRNEGFWADKATASFNFNATTGGQFTIDDYFNGVSGYNVGFTGDSTGVINLYNDVIGGTVTTDTITMNLADDNTRDYTMGKLISNVNTKWDIDIDLANNKADTITTSFSGSNGTVTIDKLNIIGGSFDNITDENFKIQILKTQNNNLRLALSEYAQAQLGEDKLLNQTITNYTDEIKLHTNWEDKYYSHEKTESLLATLGVTTTNTTDDSIGVKSTRISTTITDTLLGDTLALVNKSSIDGRTFDFDSTGDVYTVTENLGTTGSGKFTINGVAEGDNRSVIDMNGHSGMSITNASDVTIKDVTVKNATTLLTSNTGTVLSLDNADAKLRIENVNFENNKIETVKNSSGGVLDIYAGDVSLISGSFKNNGINTTSTKSKIDGGVIFNSMHIGEINADFISNYVISKYTHKTTIGAYGGAIRNAAAGVIDKLNGVFSDNRAILDGNGSAYGGAIYNNGVISEITGDYIGNYAKTSHNYNTSAAAGGAIHNRGIIGDIKADFSNNFAYDDNKSYAYGGAIHNSTEIKSIEGNFNNNYVLSEGVSAGGGAIYNKTQVGVDFIKGNFTNNYAKANGAAAYGGAIENEARIELISGIFTGNHAEAITWAQGGAIFNPTGDIENIKGDFLSNYAIATGETGYAKAGAIETRNRIGKIEGNFINNYAKSLHAYAEGGAIENRGTIDEIKGDFLNNYTLAEGSNSAGGAILNSGEIKKIVGNYTDNRAISNGSWAEGGAIFNPAGSLGEIVGNFTRNYAESTAEGGFTMGGAIHSRVTIEKIEGDFVNNHIKSLKSNALGGAIESQALIKEISGNFINNYAQSDTKDYIALGGAIFTRDSINFVADSRLNIFTGNYTQDYRGKNNNAIFVMTNDRIPTVTFNASNDGLFIFNDTIEGGTLDDERKTLKYENPYNVVLKSDSTGKIYFNNDVKNANIEHNDVTTYVNGAKYLNHAKGEGINSLTMNSGELNLGTLALAPLHFENFAMNGGTINLDSVNVDLANKVMGRISANSYNNSFGKGLINVRSMNVLSDGENDITPVPFADKSFKNTVKSDVKEVYTQIYKYDVSYDTSGKYGQDGHFVFVRGGGNSSASSAFNPAVLTNNVTTQAGASSAMSQGLYYAFEHGETFMNDAAADRFAAINKNTYALSTDFNSNGEGIDLEHKNKSVWVKPYSVFESLHLNNGPKVNLISYGSLIGFDSDIHKLKHGWANVATAYIGYNGSQIKFNGVDASTNGGLLGLTQTFYKGNFWTALTATAGAANGEAHTMYGKEDMTSLMAGIASKTGYNFEFKNGRYIIQPRMFLSYSFINTFDYTNSAGVRIDSNPMHTIQLNPAIKFIANYKEWQPYASVGMVWNLMNESSAYANGVKLPEMHTKPYVEYGLGVQKHWNEKYSAYGQAMVRNGGRNGIALSLGFRMALGKDTTEKVQKEKPATKAMKAQQNRQSNVAVTEGNTIKERRVIKQLSPLQRAHLMKNSTLTAMAGVIK